MNDSDPAPNQQENQPLRMTPERDAGVIYCVQCGTPVHANVQFCPNCGLGRFAANTQMDMRAASLFNVYSPVMDLSRLPPQQAEQFKRHQLLETFPTAVVVILHILTLGIFTIFFHGLKHSKMPKIQHDDFGAGKAIGFMFIPFFNLYWIFMFWLRLADRINFQFRLRGLPDGVNRGMAMATCILCVIPYVNIFIGGPIFMSILAGQVQSATNRLAQMQMPQNFGAAGGR